MTRRASAVTRRRPEKYSSCFDISGMDGTVHGGIIGRRPCSVMRSFTTGSFPVVQFNCGHKPFVAFGNVQFGVRREGEDRPFATAALEADAVTRILVGTS